MRKMFLGLLCLFTFQGEVFAQPGIPQEVQKLKIKQKMGSVVSGDLTFTNAEGEQVTLKELFGDRPTVLVMAYYRCPRLCSVLINNLVDALNQLSFDVGEEFQVIIVSIDPTETPELAKANKERILERYRHHENSSGSWHLLTGKREHIAKLAEAIGFPYVYDPNKKIYRHAAGITLLTPEGEVALYLFGIDFAPRDLRMGLLNASKGEISSPVDNVLLLTCFGYDPAQGKYTLAATKLMRTAGIVTVLLLGSYILWNLRKDRKQKRQAATQSGDQEQPLASGSS